MVKTVVDRVVESALDQTNIFSPVNTPVKLDLIMN